MTCLCITPHSRSIGFRCGQYLETNPLQHYKQGKKVRRKRNLIDDELRAVWNAADEIGGIFGAIVQLIMLSGQRRGEIAALLESYYSHNQQTVTLPGELTKNHLEHTFPVGAMAVQLIAAQVASDRRDSKFLFAMGHANARPVRAQNPAPLL